MKRIHIDMATGNVRDITDDEAALEALGFGKDKYRWPEDDSEDAIEKREAALTENLRRMIQ
jgi:hypothetical protein